MLQLRYQYVTQICREAGMPLVITVISTLNLRSPRGYML